MHSRRILWNLRESRDNNIDSIEKYTRMILYINTNNSYRNYIIVSFIIQKRIQIGQQSLSTTAKNVNVYTAVSAKYALVITHTLTPTHTMTRYHILMCTVYTTTARTMRVRVQSQRFVRYARVGAKGMTVSGLLRGFADKEMQFVS